MRIGIDEARRLAERGLEGLGLSATDAARVAEHLLDCELRGLGYAGLARVLSMAERYADRPHQGRPITVLSETPVSARLNGGDNVGYLVGHEATRIAIDKAVTSGIAIVGANDTWYTGMLSFYAEMATRAGLAVMIASNATPWVAPAGGTEPRFGTNPICFGFPGDQGPVIWDIGISNIIHAQAVMARRLGQNLPEDAAYDAEGRPTTDPVAALNGAFMAWGGHRGSGLGIVVQLLGMIAGSPVTPEHLSDFGYLIIAFRPDLLSPLDEVKRKVSAYSALIRDTRPVEGGPPVRMPFDRSAALRAERLAQGEIQIPDTILDAVRALAARG
ncbi:Malate/lactate/ureidoglycolate dehydrogenase, LDH2 family [Roseomonas rosea]|uniref:Malate/lactate/ureidoglycolate dehydrogenase, LDH2 family n=1 Tax=Muricoccus roseus TaxID=198092 RepID=A0A1M6HG47_9PROT|nr:Ldh family oxidoreductase [Roseomonas rosea]SHJ21171.1 Malate/lactate/ureidoglycolate dehydrogenase, LDH2 family [Roseomonas rosea]